MAVMNDGCPEKEQDLEAFCLSAKTLVRQTEESVADVRDTLKTTCKSNRFFSIALDESTDIQDTALLVSSSVAPETTSFCFEFVRLISLSRTTTVPTCVNQSYIAEG